MNKQNYIDKIGSLIKDNLLFLIIVLANLIVRTYHLASESLYGDEPYSIFYGQQQFVSIGGASGKSLMIADTNSSKKFDLIYFSNDIVGLKIASGEYVACDVFKDKSLFINTGWFGDWERFKIIKQSGDKFSLKAINGKYVSVKMNEGNVLKADADSIGSNETFITSK